MARRQVVRVGREVRDLDLRCAFDRWQVHPQEAGYRPARWLLCLLVRGSPEPCADRPSSRSWLAANCARRTIGSAGFAAQSAPAGPVSARLVGVPGCDGLAASGRGRTRRAGDGRLRFRNRRRFRRRIRADRRGRLPARAIPQLPHPPDRQIAAAAALWSGRPCGPHRPRRLTARLRHAESRAPDDLQLPGRLLGRRRGRRAIALEPDLGCPEHDMVAGSGSALARRPSGPDPRHRPRLARSCRSRWTRRRPGRPLRAPGCLQHPGEPTVAVEVNPAPVCCVPLRSRGSRPARWGQRAGTRRSRHRAFLSRECAHHPDARMSPNHTPRCGRRLDRSSPRTVPPQVRPAIPPRTACSGRLPIHRLSPARNRDDTANPSTRRKPGSGHRPPPERPSTLRRRRTRSQTAPEPCPDRTRFAKLETCM